VSYTKYHKSSTKFWCGFTLESCWWQANLTYLHFPPSDSCLRFPALLFRCPQQQQQQRVAPLARPLCACLSMIGVDVAGRQLDGSTAGRTAEMSPASSRSTVVAATFWLVVLLGNNLSASLFSGRRVRLQDLYSANGRLTCRVLPREADASPARCLLRHAVRPFLCLFVRLSVTPQLVLYRIG